jgi:EpsI family protein
VGERHDVLAARADEVARSAALAAAEPLPCRVPSRFPRALAIGAVALVLAAIAWRPAFAATVGRWLDPHGYYGHGPLVPLISGFLAWRERRRLVLAPDRLGRALGAVFLVSAMLLQVAAAALRVHFVSLGSFVLALAGASLFLGGAAFARALVFPLGFLVFGVPAPMEAIARASLALKLLAARAAIAVLGGVGVAAVREGSVVHLASGDVTVEDVCSGLRSLMALLAMGVLVAGLDRRVRLWRRAALVALAVPIALVANAVRVAFLCSLVAALGPGVVDTWIHAASGFLVYGISLGLLLLGRRALFRETLARETVADETARPGAEPLGVRGVALVALLLVPGAVATFALDRRSGASARPVALGLPLELSGWRGTELGIDPTTREVLDTNDLISRRYVKPGRSPVYLDIAASRGDRKVAHPPEVCAPGSGLLVEREDEIELVRGVRAVSLVLARGPERQVIVYCYAAGPWLGPSYVRSQLAAAVGRFRHPSIPSALVRFGAGLGANGDPEDALRSIRDFAGDLLPVLHARLTEEEGS